jgi:vancomycin aglycone glucosyltransferase
LRFLFDYKEALMKILLSSIGSRGDVQPILALALELQALGHRALICAAPNFQTWVESFGVEFTPIGPDLEQWTRASAQAPAPKQAPTEEQRRQLASLHVTDQFRVMTQAAQGCDLIIVGGVLQTAGHSVAEALKIPYLYAAYCPAVLPTPDLPPAKMDAHYSQTLSAETNRQLWLDDEAMFNRTFGDAVQAQRQSLGLMPVASVPRYISTDQPWLAADPVLGPAGAPLDADMHITQTGAWLLNDPAPLPEPLEAFLTAGESPLYFGFGSMRASDQTSRVLVEAARVVGRRAIISQGWGGLNVVDSEADCIAIGNVNHERLFPRVARVAHHGGAGTTTAAARAGKPQVIVPHHYDQFYWAHRVQVLGVGAALSNVQALTVDTLVDVLRECLTPEMTERAQALSGRIELHGARIAAERINEMFA